MGYLGHAGCQAGVPNTLILVSSIASTAFLRARYPWRRNWLLRNWWVCAFCFEQRFLGSACAVAWGGTLWALSRHGAQYVASNQGYQRTLGPSLCGREGKYASLICIMPLPVEIGTGEVTSFVGRLGDFRSRVNSEICGMIYGPEKASERRKAARRYLARNNQPFTIAAGLPWSVLDIASCLGIRSVNRRPQIPTGLPVTGS